MQTMHRHYLSTIQSKNSSRHEEEKEETLLSQKDKQCFELLTLFLVRESVSSLGR